MCPTARVAPSRRFCFPIDDWRCPPRKSTTPRVNIGLVKLYEVLACCRVQGRRLLVHPRRRREGVGCGGGEDGRAGAKPARVRTIRHIERLGEAFRAAFRRPSAAAFLSYLALSVLIFGRGVLAHPTTVYVGQERGSAAVHLVYGWWAHAISHQLNPFLTTVVWAPSGGNLAWACDFPLAACLLYPVTRLWGPIVSCNVLHLDRPAAGRMVRVRALPLPGAALLAGVARRMHLRFLALSCWPA